MKNLLFCLLLLTAIASACSSGKNDVETASRKPNILLIVIDDPDPVERAAL